MANNSNEPEKPRLEPEIIPPDRTQRGYDWRRPTSQRFTDQAGGAHRIYVARVGPLGFTLLMLVVGILAAVFLFAILGAVLIWLPVVLLLVAVGAVFRYLLR